MASGVYTRGAKILTDGTATWPQASSKDIRVLLTTSSYVPAKSHNTVADVTNELSTGGGSNYARKTTSGRTITENDANTRAEYDLDDLTYTALGVSAGTPKYAIFYLEGASDAARELIAFVDLGSADTPDGSNYLVAWDSTGAFRLNT